MDNNKERIMADPAGSEWSGGRDLDPHPDFPSGDAHASAYPVEGKALPDPGKKC